ncbi:MAG: recombinase family protein, partial [Nitrosopumilaceae archaeon]
MKIGYARVSTDNQSLNLQIDALKEEGCIKTFKDEGISGALISRPGLKEALNSLKEGDTLVVWRLDRLGRSLQHLIEIVSSLGNKNINFKSLNESIDTTTSGGELLFHIMGALAQFERKLISERTKAGLEATKKRGKKLGRPFNLTKEQINHAQETTSNGSQT